MGSYVVRVTHAALIDMLLATAEAALISPLLTARSFEHLDTYLDERAFDRGRGRRALPPSLIFSETGLEVGGTLFGNNRRNGALTEIVVERMIPTSAAIRCDDYIERSPVSTSTMADLARAADAPFGRVLGDFHSHALLSAAITDIERRQLYRPTRSDFNDDDGGEVGLVMAITFAESPDGSAVKPTTLPHSSVRIRVSDFEVWLSAFGSRSKAACDFILTLDLPDISSEKLLAK